MEGKSMLNAANIGPENGGITSSLNKPWFQSTNDTLEGKKNYRSILLRGSCPQWIASLTILLPFVMKWVIGKYLLLSNYSVLTIILFFWQL
jgi:hypothetical protein